MYECVGTMKEFCQYVMTYCICNSVKLSIPEPSVWMHKRMYAILTEISIIISLEKQ